MPSCYLQLLAGEAGGLFGVAVAVVLGGLGVGADGAGHVDAFGGVVLGEFGSDDGLGRGALLDPIDEGGKDVVLGVAGF